MLHKLELTVTDEALNKFKQTVEDCTKGKVTNPLLLLTKLLQAECESLEGYADLVFDGGGNSIGDVFKNDEDWKDCFEEKDN
ncbi:MAG: hypothetical protein ACXW2E_00780 [Nitrososphaeraceae archaeon]